MLLLDNTNTNSNRHSTKEMGFEVTILVGNRHLQAGSELGNLFPKLTKTFKTLGAPCLT